MKENYYDILQVNKNASPEIIDKAYKTLAKMYHPDLQEDPVNKKNFEEKMKLINEAYSTLSNQEKKETYDAMLEQEEYQENTQNYNVTNSYNNTEQTNNDLYSQEIKNKFQDTLKQAYHDAYIQSLKDRGYKIKYKKTPQDYLKSLIAIFSLILIFVILWQIPFIRNYFIELYNNNFIIRFIADFILYFFNGGNK